MEQLKWIHTCKGLGQKSVHALLLVWMTNPEGWSRKWQDASLLLEISSMTNDPFSKLGSLAIAAEHLWLHSSSESFTHLSRSLAFEGHCWSKLVKSCLSLVSPWIHLKLPPALISMKWCRLTESGSIFSYFIQLDLTVRGTKGKKQRKEKRKAIDLGNRSPNSLQPSLFPSTHPPLD